jgi:hypothetical protein
MNRYDILLGKKPPESPPASRKPKDLDEAITWLDKHFSKRDKLSIISDTEDEFTGKSHHGMGAYLRNTWGLWGELPLAKFFNGLGIFHADDMSGIILTSFHRKLSGKAIDLDKQIKFYKNYWKKARNG